jgi:protein gp37
MGETKIEWARYTWNPWRGCTKVSPGCTNCYADTLSGRNPKSLGQWGPDGTRVVGAESYWRLPAKWNAEAKAAGERRRVFCASLAEVFEDWPGPITDVRDRTLYKSRTGGWLDNGPSQFSSLLRLGDVRARLFRLISETPELDWLLLTKRPENLRRMLSWCDAPLHLPRCRDCADDGPMCPSLGVPCDPKEPWPNVWLGVSVEDQQRADERLSVLRSIPAAVRFVSYEPALGPVHNGGHCADCGAHADVAGRCLCATKGPLHWWICGGESGPGHRPPNLDWFRDLRDQCRAAGVPCFIKQLGSSAVRGANDPPFTYSDRKGGDPDEWPADLRVREFPEPRVHA